MRKPVTREMAAQIQAAKAAGQVPVNVRKNIQREALASQQVDMSKFYYSRIRFQFAIDDGELILLPQKRYAFGYQLQKEVDGHAGHNATYADTNLLEERSTNRGEKVRVVGIAVRPTPFTDSLLMNAIDDVTSVVLRVDNDSLLYFGNPSDIPGSSQNGEGPTFLIPPPAANSVFTTFEACKKGKAEMGNILLLKDPIIWTPEGADSKLDVLFEVNEQVRYVLPPERLATDVTGAGADDNAVVTQWAPPDEEGKPGTYVDYLVKLYVESEAPRSVNQ